MKSLSCLLGTAEVLKARRGGPVRRPQLAALGPSPARPAAWRSPDPTGTGWAAGANRLGGSLECVLQFGFREFRLLPPLSIFSLQEGDGAGLGGDGWGQRGPWGWMVPGSEV